MMSPSKVPEVFNNEFTIIIITIIIIIIIIIIIAVILNVTTFMIITLRPIGNGGPAEQI